MASALLLIPFGGHSTAAAAEVDVLINKLVEKGLLTQEEAKALLMEMQKESTREDAQVRQIASEKAKGVAQKETKTASVDLPDWLKRTKLYGDMRLRYQGQDQFDFGDLKDEWRDR